MPDRNIDDRVVADFGEEWASYDRVRPSADEHRRLFECYFSVFPFDSLPADAEGFDMGCGSGRWAEIVADRVGRLHCIDPAERALTVAKRRLADKGNAVFHLAGVDHLPLEDGSQDFGYSLGVLHHVPETERGLADCVRKLKPGAPFLVYLYYRFDNRPSWFAAVWRISDVLRRGVCHLPFPIKNAVAGGIARVIYWPLARAAKVGAQHGLSTKNWPLSGYREAAFATMRNDALDRFGTRLEKRFTRAEIREMMQKAGLVEIRFHDDEPYWVAVGFRAPARGSST
ncbi:MAG: class I SAM-dependent methyltransferase [Methyloligellaceae bacterium]